jgi:pimeloyl-ACP methyl ester carboxylesterase
MGSRASPALLGREEGLSYQTSDGVILSGILRYSALVHPLGNAILAHGLNNDKDEDGSFTKLSHLLSKRGYNVIRFDFRGHGDSEWDTEKVTISGELIDFQRTVGMLEEKTGIKGKLVVVASSFGASASILYASEHEDKVSKLVLWNPVLDYEKTFLRAETPWGRTYFNPQGYQRLNRLGYVTIPSTHFRIGKAMVSEFRDIKPYQLLSTFKIPVLTIHGTMDQSVPFSVSAKYGKPNSKSKFISHDCDHQFIGIEDTVIRETVAWILTS